MMDDARLYDYLCKFLSVNKIELFDSVAKQRTKYLTVVLEDLHQPHNANAILRNCECFGIQDVHVIENINKFKTHKKIAKGSAKWIDLHHYSMGENNTLDCIRKLKSEGYKIVTTSPHQKNASIRDFELTEKTALFFGTEFTGVSDQVLELTDDFLHIPMNGFTESLNLSVSVALCLYDLSKRLKDSEVNWQLSENEQIELKIKWAKLSIKKCELIISDYYNSKSN